MSKRSVICRKLDGLVGDQTPQKIKTEIKDKNAWAKVAKIIRIKDYTHIFKIVFRDNVSANKAMKISPAQMERENFVGVQTWVNMCLRTYSISQEPI